MGLIVPRLGRFVVCRGRGTGRFDTQPAQAGSELVKVRDLDQMLRRLAAPMVWLRANHRGWCVASLLGEVQARSRWHQG